MSKKSIIEQIDAVLKPLGFLNRGDIWNRFSENLVEVIDIQFSRGTDSYTLNAGLLDKAAHRIFWDDLPEFVEQPHCTVGVRVGKLIGDKDKWWPIRDIVNDVDQLMLSISAILEFFDELISQQKMIDWLENSEVLKNRYPPPVINLAILLALTGQSLAAFAILDELEGKLSGPWRDRVLQVRARLEADSLALR